MKTEPLYAFTHSPSLFTNPITFKHSPFYPIYKFAYTITVSPPTYNWIKIINQKAQQIYITLQQIGTYFQFKERKAKDYSSYELTVQKVLT